MPPESHPVRDERSALDKLLGLLAPVQGGEGVSALLLGLNVFLLLLAYYLLKPVREALILAGGGAEVKSYSSAGQAVLLVGVIWAYGQIGRRVGPIKLIGGANVFFAANLAVFYVLAKAKVPLGIPFFLWVGIFNVFVISQFWAFANLVYTPDQGKRLFAIVGVGASLGAYAGSAISEALIAAVGNEPLMPIAAVILFACLGLTLTVNRMRTAAAAATGPAKKEEPLGKEGGFALIAKDRYLLFIALLILLLNWVNTNGEYILDRTLTPAAAKAFVQNRSYCAAIEGKTEAEIPAVERRLRREGKRLPEIRQCDKEEFSKRYIGSFKGNYFKWVNLIGFLVQLLVVGRVFQFLGVRFAMFVLPVVSLTGYSLLGLAPVLALIRIAKIAENSSDYSIMNTSKQAMWLLTDREAKIKAKAAIDTFVVRIGDLASAGLVLLGTQVLAFSTKSFVVTNAVLVISWLLVTVGIAREHKRRSAAAEAAAKPA